MSLYDLTKFTPNRLLRNKAEMAKKDYIGREIRKMENIEGTISLYDLNHVARIRKIERNAKEIYG